MKRIGRGRLTVRLVDLDISQMMTLSGDYGTVERDFGTLADMDAVYAELRAEILAPGALFFGTVPPSFAEGRGQEQHAR